MESFTGASPENQFRRFLFADTAGIIRFDMVEGPDPKRQKAASEPRPERPTAEREPLTVTVVEPAVAHQTAVRVPHDTTVRPPVRVGRIPLPRWYWALLVLAASILYIDYRMVWAERFHDLLVHRLLPPRVVQIEHSVWRHVFGEPKEPNPQAPAEAEKHPS
jgi:hypothetical protein